MDERKKVMKMLFMGYLTLFIMLLFIIFLISKKDVKKGNIEKTVVVTGNATINVAPDIANVSFELFAREKTAKKAKDANDEMLKNLNTVLKKYNIKKDELNINHMNIRPYYEYHNNSSELVAYSAEKTITVKMKDITKYNDFIDDLLKVGISNIHSVDFALEDLKAIKDKARVKAIESAKEKAELLATTFSKKIIDVLEISEPDSSVRYFQSNYAQGNYSGRLLSQQSMLEEKMASDGALEEERGSIKVGASLSVVFLIE